MKKLLAIIFLLPSVALAQPSQGNSLLATAAKQDTGNTSLSSIDGKITAVNTGAVVISSGSLTCNAGTNLNTSLLSTSAKQDTLAGLVDGLEASATSIDGKITACNTGAVTISSSLPAGTNAIGKLSANSGVDIGDVDVTSIAAGNNNIGDVDVATVPTDPFGANADAASATGSISAKLRFIASTGIPITGNVTVNSHAVTNAGTFAVQATEVDGGNVTLGAKADAKSTATDTTAVSVMSVLKQISASVQAPPSQPVTNAGTFAVQAASAGDVAHDAGDSGNPVKVGGKAVNAFPTAVSNGDRANLITDLFGRALVASIDPAMQVHKSVNVSSTQTGTDVWRPTSGKKIAVTSVIVSSYATTGCRALLWFGDNADTTYTAGTDQLLLPFSTVPSSTIKPGVVFTPRDPVFCTTADREIHLTTDGNCSLDISVEGYEF